MVQKESKISIFFAPHYLIDLGKLESVSPDDGVTRHFVSLHCKEIKISSSHGYNDLNMLLWILRNVYMLQSEMLFFIHLVYFLRADLSFIKTFLFDDKAFYNIVYFLEVSKLLQANILDIYLGLLHSFNCVVISSLFGYLSLFLILLLFHAFISMKITLF